MRQRSGELALTEAEGDLLSSSPHKGLLKLMFFICWKPREGSAP